MSKMDWRCITVGQRGQAPELLVYCVTPHRSKLARLEIRYNSFRNHYNYGQRRTIASPSPGRALDLDIELH